MGSKEPQQEKTYILRKPIEAWEYSSEELETQISIYQYGKDDPELLTVMKDIWNEFFVEFDEVAIRKKVTEMINTAYKIGYIHDTSYLSDLTVDDALEICVDAILRITTGETLGRKQ